MRYGLEVIPFGRFADPREVVKIAQIAEAASWEGLWLWDHLVFPWAVGDSWITLVSVKHRNRLHHHRRLSGRPTCARG